MMKGLRIRIPGGILTPVLAVFRVRDDENIGLGREKFQPCSKLGDIFQ